MSMKVHGSLRFRHVSLTLIQVLKWYQTHSLDVTPIHPKEPEIESVATQPDVAHFLDAAATKPENVAISVVTPPKISLAVVQKGLQEQGVSSFWLQVSLLTILHRYCEYICR